MPSTDQQLSRLQDDPRLNEQLRLDKDKSYIHLLMPGKENNKGSLKMLRHVRNRHAYFELVKDLMRRMGYRVFENPPVYTNFFRLSKHKKFADRLQTLLMFKPLVVGPNQKEGLFLRMERAKLAYLILEEFLRIENFPRIGLEVFALHNTYEKTGKRDSRDQQKPSKAGGLDGINLVENWSIWTPWKVNSKLIRDYLGEKPAFLVMLKSHIILYLGIASPLAILAYAIILAVIPYYGLDSIHLNQFCFFMLLDLLVVGWLTILSADW